MTIKALYIDFNDTISPSNFAEAFAPFEAQTGWTGVQVGTAYIGAGLLHRLLKGTLTESDFWVEVAQITGLPIDILLQYSDAIRDTKQIDRDFIDMLHEVRAHTGLPLILLTDNVSETFHHWVDKFALKSVFDHIVNSAECGYTKLEPEIYQIALDTVKISAHEALFVDDNSDYLAVAKSVGYQTIPFRGYEALRITFEERGLLR